MPYLHITVLLIVFIFSMALLAIINVTSKTSRLNTEKDFFHAFYEKKSLDLEKMSLWITPQIYFTGMAIAPFAVGVFSFALTGNGVLSVLMGGLGLALPELVVQVLGNINESKFDERYARALQQMSSSLKAGMSILESVHDVTECRFIHESIRNRFATMALDMEMGIGVSEAFHRFADSTNSRDARDVAIALDVQNEIGGHEAEVIEEITDNIHRRIMLRKEVKSTFAGTTSLVWMMDIIPIGTLVFYSLTTSSVADFYTQDPLHFLLIFVIIGCFIAGSVVNHKLLKKTIKGE